MAEGLQIFDAAGNTIYDTSNYKVGRVVGLYVFRGALGAIIYNLSLAGTGGTAGMFIYPLNYGTTSSGTKVTTDITVSGNSTSGWSIQLAVYNINTTSYNQSVYDMAVVYGYTDGI